MKQSSEAPEEGLGFLTPSFDPNGGAAASQLPVGFLIHNFSGALYPAFPAGRLSCRILLGEPVCSGLHEAGTLAKLDGVQVCTLDKVEFGLGLSVGEAGGRGHWH